MTIFFLSKCLKKREREGKKSTVALSSTFPSWELTEEINFAEANFPFKAICKEK